MTASYVITILLLFCIISQIQCSGEKEWSYETSVCKSQSQRRFKYSRRHSTTRVFAEEHVFSESQQKYTVWAWCRVQCKSCWKVWECWKLFLMAPLFFFIARYRRQLLSDFDDLLSDSRWSHWRIFSCSFNLPNHFLLSIFHSIL